jgi:hypothetical protein
LALKFTKSEARAVIPGARSANPKASESLNPGAALAVREKQYQSNTLANLSRFGRSWRKTVGALP